MKQPQSDPKLPSYSEVSKISPSGNTYLEYSWEKFFYPRKYSRKQLRRSFRGQNNIICGRCFS